MIKLAIVLIFWGAVTGCCAFKVIDTAYEIVTFFDDNETEAVEGTLTLSDGTEYKVVEE
jgi:hypothetical protein